MDGHDHHIQTSLLPLKKRASNYNSGPSRSFVVDDPYASSSKKKRMANDNNVVGAETKAIATGAFEAPVPRQRRRLMLSVASSREPAAELPAAPVTPLSAEPTAEGNAALSDEEKKQLSKGKWLARGQESSSRQVRVPLTPQLQQLAAKKLMHDGIRGFVPQQSIDDDRHRHDFGEALERRLAELEATRPWLVYRKTLQKSDVDENQNRLLVSCKSGSGTGGCPITRCFSPDELKRVQVKDIGLRVTALDRDGNPYALTCKFLTSNNGYRFITEWKDFLIKNSMNLSSQRHGLWTRDVEVELWAFRSRRLPFQPQIKVVNGKNVTAVERVSQHLDPDGSLGLLLLHHENKRRHVKIEEEEGNNDREEPLSPSSVARNKKGKQQSVKRGVSASALVSPVALHASSVPVAEQGGGLRSEPTFLAAVGLAKLRQGIWDLWQEYVDQRKR